MSSIMNALKAIKWRHVYIVIIMIILAAIVGYSLYGLVMIIQSRRAVAEIELPDLDAKESEEEEEEKAFTPPEELVVELVDSEEEKNPIFKTDEEKVKKNEELFYEQLVIEGKTHILPPEKDKDLPEMEEIDPVEAIKTIKKKQAESDKDVSTKTSSEKEYNKNDMARIVESELAEDELSELVEDILSDDVIDDYDYKTAKKQSTRKHEPMNTEVIKDSSFDDMLENILLDDEESA